MSGDAPDGCWKFSQFMVLVLASVFFGVWRESFWAGVFMVNLLSFVMVSLEPLEALARKKVDVP